MTALAATPSLADPADYLAIEDLELASLGIVEGIWQGLRRSPFRGAGIEFESHRDYRPGDDPRHLDTAVFARSRRLCTKEYRAETNLPLYLILDHSGSMAVANGAPQKWAYAARCAAALGRLAMHSQDAVGLSLLSDRVTDHLPPRTGRTHFQNLLGTLGGCTASVDFTNSQLATALGEAANHCHRRGLVIILSDFFDAPDAIISALSRFSAARHEVVAFQLLDPYELALPTTGDLEVEDAETGNILRLSAADVRAAHTAAVTAWQTDFASRCAALGIDHFATTTDAPLTGTLVKFLEHRHAR
jgi:uncharacterized protein (DUF58 family)